VWIAWGGNQVLEGEANLHEYSFDTIEELNAFLHGVDEAYGHDNYTQFDTAEEAEAFRVLVEHPEQASNGDRTPIEWPEWATFFNELESTHVDFDEPITIEVDGNGLWSAENCPDQFNVVSMSINYCSDEYNHGELQVVFDDKLWIVEEHGLIYTDDTAEEGIRSMLLDLGITGHVNYSEQGMQGQDYISLDVDADFLASYAEYLKKTKGDSVAPSS